MHYVRLACVSLLSYVCQAAPRAYAHPGQSLEVKIEIRDDGVHQRLLISADLVLELFRANNVEYKLPEKVGDDYSYADADVEQTFQDTLADIFAFENPVTIDDVDVEPEFRGAEFVEAGMPGYPVYTPPDVRVTLFYAAPGEPQRVSLIWTIFPRDPMRMAFGLPEAGGVVAELDAYDENLIIVFSETEPEYIWHTTPATAADRPGPVVAALTPPRLSIPTLSIGLLVAWFVVLGIVGVMRETRRVPRGLLLASVIPLAAAGLARDVLVLHVQTPWGTTVALPDETQAEEIFRALQTNVYRAFEKKEPSDIYDVLAYSVDGDLLDEVYNEVYQSLILRDQGGAVARIKGVEIEDVTLDHAGVLPDARTPAFSLRSRWRVHGAVYHWGHVHSRTNEYTAKFTVAQRGENWKLTAINDLTGERIVGEEDDPAILAPPEPINPLLPPGTELSPPQLRDTTP